jgi:very-short-patch-repair endonuclease
MTDPGYVDSLPRHAAPDRSFWAAFGPIPDLGGLRCARRTVGRPDASRGGAFRFGTVGAPRRGVKLHRLEAFIARHHGLVTLDAVRDLGLSRSTWQRALHEGQLELIHPGVARVIGWPCTREQSIAAAVLAAGPGAMASHRSAIYLWDIPRPPDDPPELILPQRYRQATLEGVVVHRPRDLRDLGAVLRRGIPTVKLLRALCDLGAVDPASVHPAVGHVVTNRLASPNSLFAAIRMHGRRGRPGVPALRDALADWMVDGKFLDSELERRMKRLIKHYKLPTVEFHPLICGYEIDFRVVGTAILLECDGWEFHDKHRRRFEDDRRRRNVLTAAGWIVVNFTWSMLTRHPQWVAAIIAEAVRKWSAWPVPTIA